jgi:hypothetical protein
MGFESNLQQYNVAILDKALYQQCALNCYEIISEHWSVFDDVYEG